jgi:hypothetical protein
MPPSQLRLGAYRLKSRCTLRGSSGVPSCIVKMNPAPSTPNALRCAVCATRCPFSSVTTWSSGKSVLPDCPPLTSRVTRCPSTLRSWRCTPMACLRKSTSSHRSPSASPLRKPVANITMKSRPNRWSPNAFSSLLASAGVSVRPSACPALGALVSFAAFRSRLLQRGAHLRPGPTPSESGVPSTPRAVGERRPDRRVTSSR